MDNSFFPGDYIIPGWLKNEDRKKFHAYMGVHGTADPCVLKVVNPIPYTRKKGIKPKPSEHLVTHNFDMPISCSCPDFIHRKSELSLMCKHMLRVWLVLLLWKHRNNKPTPELMFPSFEEKAMNASLTRSSGFSLLR